VQPFEAHALQTNVVLYLCDTIVRVLILILQMNLPRYILGEKYVLIYRGSIVNQLLHIHDNLITHYALHLRLQQTSMRRFTSQQFCLINLSSSTAFLILNFCIVSYFDGRIERLSVLFDDNIYLRFLNFQSAP